MKLEEEKWLDNDRDAADNIVFMGGSGGHGSKSSGWFIALE